MKQVGLLVVLLIAALGLVHGQVPFPGQCPDVKPQEDFKLDDYMGVWYEYEKYPFVPEVGRKCMFATYTKTTADTISVVNAAINRFNGNPTNVTGSARVVASGQLSVSFPNSRSANTTKVNYEVLGTDYTSYAVVHSCTPFLRVVNARLLWVLTREREPPKEVIDKAEAVIDANKLNKAFLMRTVQTGCTEGEADAANDDPAADDAGEATTLADPMMENVFMAEMTN